MALGIPTICSDMGTNREVIRHGQNGFLATTPEDWVNLLTHLIDNSEVRDKLGQMGRKTVEDNYSMRVCAQLFADVVYETIAKNEKKKFAEEF